MPRGGVEGGGGGGGGSRGGPLLDSPPSLGHSPGAWLLRPEEKAAVKATVAGAVPDAWLRGQHPSKVLRQLASVQEQAAKESEPVPWIDSRQADVIFCTVIFASAVVTGIDIEIHVRGYEITDVMKLPFLIGQMVFLLLFLIEFVLHIRAHGLKYASPRNPAGCFDAIVVVFGIVDLTAVLFAYDASAVRFSGAMRGLRLLRLARVVRVFLVCKELNLLCQGAASAFSTVSWSFFLLSLMMYVGSLFCCILTANIGENSAPDGDATIAEYFGSVPKALFTHFTVVTFEAWPDVSDTTMDASGSSFWALYFIAFILITSLALMNLVTGVVCEKLVSLTEIEKLASQNPENCKLSVFQSKTEEFGKVLHEILQDVDPKSCSIDPSTFEEVMEDSEIKQLLSSMNVSRDVESGLLFELFDVDGHGFVSHNQLLGGLLSVRKSADRLDSLLLQHNLVRTYKRHEQCIDAVVNNHAERMVADLAWVEEHLASDFAAIHTMLASARPAQRPGMTAPNGHNNMDDEVANGIDASKNEAAPDKKSLAVESRQLGQLVERLDELNSSAEALLDVGRVPPKSSVQDRATISVATQTVADTEAANDNLNGLNGKRILYGIMDL